MIALLLDTGRLVAALLLLSLVAACSTTLEPEVAPPAARHRILVPIYFYQGHSVGKASRPTGLQGSVNGGATWKTLAWPELISNSVAVDATGRWLYLACGNGVLVSRDGGRTWRLTGGWEMTEVQKVCIDRRDPRRAWAATAYGVFFTPDVTRPGNPWTKADTPFRYCTDVLQDVSDPDTLWVASDTGVYVSRSMGLRFDSEIQEVSARRLHQLPDGTVLVATDGRRLLRTRPEESTYEGVDGTPDVVFCIASRGEDTLWLGSMESVHVSRDGGRSWTEFREGIPDGFFVYGILPDPDDPRRLLACGNDGVLESRDDGATWRRLGFEGALVPDLAAAPMVTGPSRGISAEGGPTDLTSRELDSNRLPADPAFEKRRAAILEALRALPPPADDRWMGWFRATVAAKDAKRDGEFWVRVRAELERPPHSMFFSMPLIGFYLHVGWWPGDVAVRIEQVMTENPVYRGDTENHWVMHYAALLLASETWPWKPASQWYTGQTTQEIHDEAKGWLLHWARLAATRGQGEFDSPNYLFMYVTPMLLLHDFARDPEVRQVAGMMLDLLLADYFVESLDGAYCGGHSRIIGAEVERTTGNRVTALHYLYAGGIPRPEKIHPWMAFAALSSYRPPAVLAAIANRRDAPYQHRETKRVRNVIRLGKELNPPVHKVTYMTGDYALGSLHGGILQPIQQHTWDVTWKGSAENSTLFTVHPSVSARELAMFFPEEIRDLTRTITLQKGTYSSPDKLVSASPWERVFQRENVLFALYRVPPGERFPHVDLYVPDCLEISEQGDWTFGRDGDFLVAWWAGQSGTWIHGDGYRRFRCDGRSAAFVFVTQPQGIGDLGSFQAYVVRGSGPFLSRKSEDLQITYTLPGGGIPEGWAGFSWSDRRRSPPDRLYDGPFLNSVYGSGVIEMTDGETTRVLDFNELTIEERR